jgi:hypothetical protein
MANINEAFNSNFENIIKINNHNDSIDHFFTQRKVTEFEEVIDKNMNRKEEKKEVMYNFIAISIPYFQRIENDEIIANINIWGDEQFKYTGNLKSSEGIVPYLLFKLTVDKQLFVCMKLNMKKGEELVEKDYVTFITIPKRYQIEPKIN